MLNFSDLLTFSHTHCITICAMLVPLNLLTTLQTLILVGLNRSTGELIWSTGFASLFSGVMVLHVLTWFVVGVVMVPTYILLMLGSVCLGMNLWAFFGRQSLRSVINWLGRSLKLA